MAFADGKMMIFIMFCIFYGVSIPLTIHWLLAYKMVAKTRHKCITSRHFNTTWAYLICCICASNIGHPLSILLHYILHYSNTSISLIIICYLLSDISTYSVFYMCLIRAYMMMWDKKYNLARKEQFWTKKIVNDELEVYEINEIQHDDDNNTLSPYIKYRRNLGNIQYVSVFILCILAPITLFFTISPFIFIIHHQNLPLQHKLSSIFRFVSTIPIVSILLFIYFKIPKMNKAIGLRLEVKVIVQIICITFISSDLIISFIFYCMINMIQQRYIQLINNIIHILSAFLLFYTSTGLILPRLRKIVSQTKINNTGAIPTKRRPFGLNSNKLQFLIFSWSNHKTNKPNLSSLAIPPFADLTLSAEKKLRKSMTIWRRRRDMPRNRANTNNDTVRKETFSAMLPLYNHSTRTDNLEAHQLHETTTDTINDDFSFIDVANATSSLTNNAMHLLQHTSSELKFNRIKDEKIEAYHDRPFEIVHSKLNNTEIEEMEEFDDEEVAVNVVNDDNITDNEDDEDDIEEEIEIDDTAKGSSYTIGTGLQSISPAFITPQISKTSDSKPHSRRTSSRFNPSELVNITTTTVTFSGHSNKIVLPSSNRSNSGHRDNSSRSTPIGRNKIRRHSLSVKEAYAGIKQIFGGNRNSMKSNSRSNCDDPQEKIYFEITLEDPLNVVLSDQDGLSRFADHLCSEFSIENLLFIVEALQYRYCIPLPLFDDILIKATNIIDSEVDDNNNSSDIIINDAESVEVLMHIIHQNKKLPISKLLKEHRSCCCFVTNPNNYKTHKQSLTRSASQDPEGVDFMSSSVEINMTPIRRKSGSGDKIESCCKECTVEKFKYIIEKYVETTSINLPSATQKKLMNIWNELKIKDPKQRFLNKTQNKIKAEPTEKKKKRKRVNKKKKKDRELSKSKSKSKSKSNHIAIIKKLKRSKDSKKKKDDRHEAEEEEEEEENDMKTTSDKASDALAKQGTLSSEEHIIGQIPSHSVSPRAITKVELTEIDVNVNSNDVDRIPIASYSNVTAEGVPVASFSNADTPSHISHIPAADRHTSHNSHNSQVSISHLTSTPITNNTDTTPTDCEEEDDTEPLPASQSTGKKTASSGSQAEQVISATTHSSSLQDCKEEENEEQKVEEEEEEIEIERNEEIKEEKEADQDIKIDIENEEHQDINEEHHDGFGNINFITVFDDAILEIMKLMKSDTWRRFKRSKQFLDWANDFKPS